MKFQDIHTESFTNCSESFFGVLGPPCERKFSLSYSCAGLSGRRATQPRKAPSQNAGSRSPEKTPTRAANPANQVHGPEKGNKRNKKGPLNTDPADGCGPFDQATSDPWVATRTNHH